MATILDPSSDPLLDPDDDQIAFGSDGEEPPGAPLPAVMISNPAPVGAGKIPIGVRIPPPPAPVLTEDGHTLTDEDDDTLIW